MYKCKVVCFFNSESLGKPDLIRWLTLFGKTLCGSRDRSVAFSDPDRTVRLSLSQNLPHSLFVLMLTVHGEGAELALAVVESLEEAAGRIHQLEHVLWGLKRMAAEGHRVYDRRRWRWIYCRVVSRTQERCYQDTHIFVIICDGNSYRKVKVEIYPKKSCSHPIMVQLYTLDCIVPDGHAHNATKGLTLRVPPPRQALCHESFGSIPWSFWEAWITDSILGHSIKFLKFYDFW